MIISIARCWREIDRGRPAAARRTGTRPIVIWLVTLTNYVITNEYIYIYIYIYYDNSNTLIMMIIIISTNLIPSTSNSNSITITKYSNNV